MTIDNKNYNKVKKMLQSENKRNYWKVKKWDGPGCIIRNGELVNSSGTRTIKMKKAEKVIKGNFHLSDLLSLDDEINLRLQKQINRKLTRNKINYKSKEEIPIKSYDKEEVLLLIDYFFEKDNISSTKIDNNKFVPAYSTIKQNYIGAMEEIKKEVWG